MKYARLVLLGDRDWLQSRQVRQVRADRHAGGGGCRSAIIDMDDRAVRLLEQLNEDWQHVVLVQLGDHGADRLARMASVTAGQRLLRWVAVTRTAADSLMRRCVELNAWGQLFESASTRTYQETLGRVEAGKLTYPPAILDRIVTRQGRMTLSPLPSEMLMGLSSDQRVLLKLLAEGYTTARAADKMGISPRSAGRCKRALLKKIQVSDLASLIRFAIRARLIDP